MTFLAHIRLATSAMIFLAMMVSARRSRRSLAPMARPIQPQASPASATCWSNSLAPKVGSIFPIPRRRADPACRANVGLLPRGLASLAARS